MDKIIDKLDPIVAVLVLGNALQYVYNRRDVAALTTAVSGLSSAVTKVAERLGNGGASKP